MNASRSSRKRTKRGERYQAMAAGYQVLKSPLAGAYSAAAEHYDQHDAPLEASSDGPDAHLVRSPERDGGRG